MLHLPGDVGIAHDAEAIHVGNQEWAVQETGFLQHVAPVISPLPLSENQPPNARSSDCLPRAQMAMTPVRTEVASISVVRPTSTLDVGDAVERAGSGLERNAQAAGQGLAEQQEG